MKKSLGIAIIMLFAIGLVGCPKTDEDNQAKEGAAAPEVAPAATAEEVVAPAAETVAATIPTKLGDTAYPLVGLTWVKGEPVTLAPGKVYVVEFWATWCPPCRKSIPHLTELQAKYGDRVTFVGVSQEPLGTVKTFVDKQGDEMAYTVAVDTAGEVNKGYMRAFAQGGIPCAFIVDAKGKVVWHGHPLSPIEEVLDQVLAEAYSIPG